MKTACSSAVDKQKRTIEDVTSTRDIENTSRNKLKKEKHRISGEIIQTCMVVSCIATTCKFFKVAVWKKNIAFRTIWYVQSFFIDIDPAYRQSSLPDIQ